MFLWGCVRICGRAHARARSSGQQRPPSPPPPPQQQQQQQCPLTLLRADTQEFDTPSPFRSDGRRRRADVADDRSAVQRQRRLPRVYCPSAAHSSPAPRTHARTQARARTGMPGQLPSSCMHAPIRCSWHSLPFRVWEPTQKDSTRTRARGTSMWTQTRTNGIARKRRRTEALHGDIALTRHARPVRPCVAIAECEACHAHHRFHPRRRLIGPHSSGLSLLSGCAVGTPYDYLERTPASEAAPTHARGCCMRRLCDHEAVRCWAGLRRRDGCCRGRPRRARIMTRLRARCGCSHSATAMLGPAGL